MIIEIKDLHKAELFVGIFQYIRQFTEHVNLMFEEDRFYMQSMDSSRVIIFEIILPSEWFCHYELNSGSKVIGINSILLSKVLNAREKTQTIQIEYSETDTDKLQFHFCMEKSSEKSVTDRPISIAVFDKHFELPLIDVDSDLLDIPHIDHQAEFSLNSITFSNLVNQLKNFGDTMQIKCSEEKIELFSFSLDSGKMFAEIPIDDLTEFAIAEGEVLNISFSLKFLHDICLYQKLNKEVEIKISNNFPMVILYRLGAKQEDETEEPVARRRDPQITFYLAPKMDETV
jgi:proliferating cell nuclear antigen PCNA